MNARVISVWIGLCGPLLVAQPHLVSSQQLYTDVRTGLTLRPENVEMPGLSLRLAAS